MGVNVIVRRVRLGPWELNFDGDGTIGQVRGEHDNTTQEQWRQISERIRDDLRDAVVPNDPTLWAAEWVEVDGSVITYLGLVRQSVLGNWDEDTWRRVLAAQLRGRIPAIGTRS